MIFTIGHSTRSLDAFIALLDEYGVVQLGDIRSVPRSRRHPHFAMDALSVSLPQAGVAYRHFPGLGGHRKARPDSPNTAWRHEAFRGYADYMQTPEFEHALDDLAAFAADATTAIMCAEAVWWRCHRRLTADALVARGVEVRHIMSDRASPPHALSEFARVAGGKVIYPGLI